MIFVWSTVAYCKSTKSNAGPRVATGGQGGPPETTWGHELLSVKHKRFRTISLAASCNHRGFRTISLPANGNHGGFLTIFLPATSNHRGFRTISLPANAKISTRNKKHEFLPANEHERSRPEIVAPTGARSREEARATPALACSRRC